MYVTVSNRFRYVCVPDNHVSIKKCMIVWRKVNEKINSNNKKALFFNMRRDEAKKNGCKYMPSTSTEFLK